jgi:hypothetical protein
VTAEGEIGRVLNALSATLNDQRAERFEPERVQEIVTQTLGRQPSLTARPDPGHPDTGWLLDEQGERVAEVRRAEGRWEVERLVDARSETYLPSEPPKRDKAKKQAKEGRMPLIGSAALAVIVFVVLLVVLGVTLWVCILVALAVLLAGGAVGVMGKQKLSE